MQVSLSQPGYQNINVIIEFTHVNLIRKFKFGVKEGASLKDIKKEVFRQGSKICFMKGYREKRQDYEVHHYQSRVNADGISTDFFLADAYVFIKDNPFTIDNGVYLHLKSQLLPPRGWKKFKIKARMLGSSCWSCCGLMLSCKCKQACACGD
jgi:hypothetical protein